MFGQIPPTEFDLRFTTFGIPVRVHPVFWLTSAFLAWGGTDGDLRLIVVRVLCIFVAILVHELGHALVTGLFGWDSEIVLYFFGGYATSTRHSTWKDIAVSAAGPGAGFLLYFALRLLVRFLVNHEMLLDNPQASEVLLDALGFSLFINFAWNCLNLIPVLPLDGGQISRELCCWLNPRRGMQHALLLSAIVAGGVGLLALQRAMNDRGLMGLDPRFLALMFGYLAYQSYLSYQSEQRGYR